MKKKEMIEKMDAIITDYFSAVSQEKWNLPESTISEGNPAETFAGFALAAVVLGGIDPKEIFTPIFKMFLNSGQMQFNVSKQIATELIQKSITDGTN